MKAARIINKSDGNFLALERIDDWQHYTYQHRYLDALARILLVNSTKNVVSAICKHGNVFYLSYNRTLPESDIVILDNMIQCISNPNWQGLLILNFKNNELDFSKKVKAYITANESSIPESIRDLVRAFVADLSKKENILLEYRNLIDDIISDINRSPEQIDKTLKLTSLASMLLRPYQDVYKISFIFNEKMERGKNLILLDNKLELHAESNIQYQLKVFDIYIGISRLSCVDCDKGLWDGLLPHRGTHGIYFEQCSQGLVKILKANKMPINQKLLTTSVSEIHDIALNANLLEQFSIRKKLFEHKNGILVEKKAIEKMPHVRNPLPDEQALESAKKDLEKELSERFSLSQQADLSDDEDIEKRTLELKDLRFKSFKQNDDEEKENLWELKQKLGISKGNDLDNNSDEEDADSEEDDGISHNLSSREKQVADFASRALGHPVEMVGNLKAEYEYYQDLYDVYL